MTDTSGPTSPTPFAFYDPDESCWKTSQGTFPWDSATYSATWPRSGMTRGGAAFELPTPAHPTAANECSSLLLTPTAGDTAGGRASPGVRGIDKDGSGGLREQVRTLLPTPVANDDHKTPEAHIAAKAKADGHPRSQITSLDVLVRNGMSPTLLPTPAASNLYGDMEVEDFEALRERWKAKHGNGNGHGTPLGIAVKSLPTLLPTPTAMDSVGARNSTARRRPDSTGHPGDTLTDAVWKTHGAPEWAKTNLPSIGVSTPPPSTDGNTPSDDPPPHPPTTPDDSTPDSWNG